MTAAAALVEDAAATLAAAGVPAPEWDAERLLRHVLGWDRAALVANPDRRRSRAGGGALPRARPATRLPRAPAAHPRHPGLLEARVPRHARRPDPAPRDGAARRDEPGAPEGRRATADRGRRHGLRLHRPLARRRAARRRGARDRHLGAGPGGRPRERAAPRPRGPRRLPPRRPARAGRPPRGPDRPGRQQPAVRRSRGPRVSRAGGPGSRARPGPVSAGAARSPCIAGSPGRRRRACGPEAGWSSSSGRARRLPWRRCAGTTDSSPPGSTAISRASLAAWRLAGPDTTRPDPAVAAVG